MSRQNISRLEMFFLRSCRYANYMQEEFDNKKEEKEHATTSIYTAQPSQEEVIEGKMDDIAQTICNEDHYE